MGNQGAISSMFIKDLQKRKRARESTALKRVFLKNLIALDGSLGSVTFRIHNLIRENCRRL